MIPSHMARTNWKVQNDCIGFAWEIIVLYEVDTRVQQIVILYVRHRRDVYRAL
jgi:hypothetical protein